LLFKLYTHLTMVTLSTDENFTTFLQSREYVVVKYFVNWCGICRLFSPKFKKMSDKAEFSPFLFLSVNAEENPEARKLGKVNSLPFFAVFKNGQFLSGIATSKEEVLENMIRQLD
jgi:thioredoxin 1